MSCVVTRHVLRSQNGCDTKEMALSSVSGDLGLVCPPLSRFSEWPLQKTETVGQDLRRQVG